MRRSAQAPCNRKVHMSTSKLSAERAHMAAAAERFGLGPAANDAMAIIGDVNSSAKGSGARFNDGKPNMFLVPLTLVAQSLHPSENTLNDTSQALHQLGCYQANCGTEAYLWNVLSALGVDGYGWEECARVFSYGQKKYAAWNWAKGMPWSVPLACAARHLMAMCAGELIDKESGLPHRGHVFCNIVMLLTYRKNYPEGNDLPTPGLL